MQSHISRRKFLSRTAAAGACLGFAGFTVIELPAATAKTLPEPTVKQLPPWHGFNLLVKFS